MVGRNYYKIHYKIQHVAWPSFLISAWVLPHCSLHYSLQQARETFPWFLHPPWEVRLTRRPAYSRAVQHLTVDAAAQVWRWDNTSLGFAGAEKGWKGRLPWAIERRGLKGFSLQDSAYSNLKATKKARRVVQSAGWTAECVCVKKRERERERERENTECVKTLLCVEQTMYLDRPCPEHLNHLN